jgi:anaerobic magnesium-protoporphyrin IX monomethyl ester cyclase
VVRGEAELSFAEFIYQRSRSKKINVEGIYLKDDLTNSTEFRLSDQAADLDMLPFPDWELIDMNTYVTSLGRQREIGTEHRTASLITTRGCPFRCTFCSAHTVHGRKMRFRSAKNVIDEIRLLNEKYGVTLFMPEDDLFTADHKRVLELLTAIKNLGISGIEVEMPNGLSVNALDSDVVDELISVGMRIFVLAIESGSEYVQKHMIKKNCDLEKARRLVNLLKSRGILVRCYFILGFHTETKGQMQETVNYAKSLGADWCVFNIATPLVGSEMYDQLVEIGCIKDNVDTWSNTVFDRRQFDTPETTAEDLNDFAYRANLDCNFLNNPNKVNGRFEKAVRIYRDVVSRYPFHVIAWYCIMECYRGLGDEGKAKRVEMHLRKLIQSDKRAAEMFAKYGDMIGPFAHQLKTQSLNSLPGNCPAHSWTTITCSSSSQESHTAKESTPR